MILGLLGALVVVATLLGVWLRSPRDRLTGLLFVLTVSAIFPQRFTVVGLDTLGAPALLLGLGLLLLHGVGLLHPPSHHRTSNAARYVLVVFVAAWMLRLAVGLFPASSPMTITSIVRSTANIAALLGFALYTTDAVTTRADLRRLVRGLVWIVAAVSVVGMVQFLGWDPMGFVNLPGLEETPTIRDERIRSGFVRARGTAFHPIEYSVVLAMALPLGIHLWQFGLEGRGRRLAKWCALLLGVGAIMSVSRSGILSVGVALLVIALHRPWVDRLRLAGGALAVLVLVYFAVPGLLGTLRNLFLRTGNDASIQGRQDDFPVVLEYFRDAPLLGQGAGQVTVEDVLLDNEYFNQLINGGLVSLVALLVLLFVPLGWAWWSGTVAADAELRSLGSSLAAALAAGAVSLATFDGFFFRLYGLLLMVLVAAAGTIRRLAREERRAAARSAPAWAQDQDRSTAPLPA